MWVIIFVVIAFLIYKSIKKRKNNSTNRQTTTTTRFSVQKYRNQVRASGSVDKLTPEGDLPYGWAFAYDDFIKEAQAEYMHFYNEYVDNKYGDPKKRYATLKSLLVYIEDAKKIYAQKGECFLYWFVTTWAREDEVEKLSTELDYIKEHYTELEEEYKRRQYIDNILIPDIKKKAVQIIKNNPGIIQTEVYGHFEPNVKKYVQNALRDLSENGKIKKEKYGRTYKLSI